MDELSGYPPPAVIRSSHAWRKLRGRFRDHCMRINAPCRWCVLRGDLEHAAIDYYARRGSPHARSKPITSNPPLAGPI
jgi:hypothetical protein